MRTSDPKSVSSSKRWSRAIGWAFLDQATVSATGFLGSVFVGRAGGPEELGKYTLGLAVAIVAAGAQDALISSPLTTIGSQLSGEHHRRAAGSAWIHACVLAMVASGLIAFCALIAHLLGAESWILPWALQLSVMIPAAQARQFGRKFAFIQHQPKRAAVVDSIVMLVHIAIVGYAFHEGKLTVGMGFLAITISCAVGGFIGWMVYRKHLELHLNEAWKHWREHWKLGKWVLASRWIGVMHSNVIVWLLGFIGGMQAAGVYAASLNVVSVSNLFLFGLANAIEPAFAQVLADCGPNGLRRMERRVTGMVVVVMMVFCLSLAIFGSTIIEWLFTGREFLASPSLVTLLAAAFLVDAIGVGPNQALRVTRRMPGNVRAGIVGLAITAITAPIGIHFIGVIGAATALLAGYGATTTLRHLALSRVLDNEWDVDSPPPPAKGEV